jgi:NhaP-type Na+/H+ or K+/H+ antiporter
MTGKILKEALVVGVGLVIVGMVLHLLAKYIMKHDMNDNMVLAVHFFIAGFVLHLLCEYFGVNKWYCVNGNACST